MISSEEVVTGFIELNDSICNNDIFLVLFDLDYDD